MDHDKYPDSRIFSCEMTTIFNIMMMIVDVFVISSLCDLQLQSKFSPAMPTTGLKMHSTHFKIVKFGQHKAETSQIAVGIAQDEAKSELGNQHPSICFLDIIKPKSPNCTTRKFLHSIIEGLLN
jgi:hypothetical protein